MTTTTPRRPRREPFERLDATSRATPEIAHDKVLAAHDNPVFPQGIRSSSSSRATPEAHTSRDTLARYAARATDARGSRQNLDFPELQRAYRRGRIDRASGERGQGGSYERDVWLYLTTWGFRTLNDMRGDGIERPNADDLGDLFAERIHERGVVWHPYDGRGPRGSLSTDHADRLAEDAAHAVIRDWSPTWRDEQAERGRRGGSKSKRRPEWERDTSKLDALAALMADEPHLTVPKLADRLGVSPRTITNMRTVLRNRDA